MGVHIDSEVGCVMVHRRGPSLDEVLLCEVEIERLEVVDVGELDYWLSTCLEL